MGWAVGYDSNLYRFVGYGVPSICEYPTCNEKIDRGLGHACRDGILRDDGCGRYFCGGHLFLPGCPHEERGEKCTDRLCDLWVCERCDAGLGPFEMKPETNEWLTHLLTDESWEQWRSEEPAMVAMYQEQLSDN